MAWTPRHCTAMARHVMSRHVTTRHGTARHGTARHVIARDGIATARHGHTPPRHALCCVMLSCSEPKAEFYNHRPDLIPAEPVFKYIFECTHCGKSVKQEDSSSGQRTAHIRKDSPASSCPPMAPSAPPSPPPPAPPHVLPPLGPLRAPPAADRPLLAEPLHRLWPIQLWPT